MSASTKGPTQTESDFDCAAEPIHVPGAIQPHGWRVAIEPATARIVAYSANSEQLTGFAPGALQTATLQALVDGLQPHLETGALPCLACEGAFICRGTSGNATIMACPEAEQPMSQHLPGCVFFDRGLPGSSRRSSGG